MNRYISFLCAFLFANAATCLPVYSQKLVDPQSVPAASAQPAQGKPAGAMAQAASPDYVLGAGDQIALVVSGLEDQYNEKIFRIDASGDVTLPLVGRMHAAGLSAADLEGELRTKLSPILKDPQVVVIISSFGSEPVSVLGSVRTPGIVQLQGKKNLFEVLSMAGGLQPDAGYIVQVTRPFAPIPLPGAKTDPNSQVTVASIRLKDIINIPNAAQNIEIFRGDTISVPKAGVVYVVGSVTKPGGFPLDENESLSALQVLSLAEGLKTASAASKARILRTVPGSPERAEIPVDLNRLMAGKASDIQLHADDILFVPGSEAKKAGLRTLEAIVNAATYASVYARP
jgi:polysaccharide export outer membrane protein